MRKLQGFLLWLLCLLPLGALRAGEIREFAIDGAKTLAEEVTGELIPQLRAMRFNEAVEEWNLDVVVTNASFRTLQLPVFLMVDSLQHSEGVIAPDGLTTGPEPKPFFVLRQSSTRSSVLEIAGLTLSRTLRLKFSNDPAAPSLGLRIFANGRGDQSFALGFTRTLNDVGQPLGGVQVLEASASGQRVLLTDPEYGLVTLGQAPGNYVWRFEKAGMFPAWRSDELKVGQVQLLPSPRLTEKPSQGQLIGPLGGTVQGSASLQLQVSPGSLPSPTPISLTPLRSQALPFPMPTGWSPAASFWLDAGGASLPGAGLSIVATPLFPISPTETAVLIRLTEPTPGWQVVSLIPGGGTNALTVALPGAGAYAMVLLDVGTGGDVATLARVGSQLLAVTTPTPLASTLSAKGVVSPARSAASRNAAEVTATASLTLTTTDPVLPSGSLVRGRVRESYLMQDGSRRFVPPYEEFMIGYQRPGDALRQTVQADFPVRPLLLFGGDTLAEARVSVEVLRLQPFDGQLFRASGGSLASGNVLIKAPEGAFSAPQAGLLELLPFADFSSLVVGADRFSVVAAFDLAVPPPNSGRSLSLDVRRLPASSRFVLGKVTTRGGTTGLEPIERFETGTNAVLKSLEPDSADRLPGIRGPGLYVLVQVPSVQVLIKGTALDGSGQPAVGFPVQIQGSPWKAFVAADGTYRLLAPTGSAQVTVSHPQTGESDIRTIQVDVAESILVAGLATKDRGPRVIQLSPADGAERVSSVTPIVLTFSESLNPSTIGADSVTLVTTNGQRVAVSLGLNQRGTSITLLPREALPSGQTFRLLLAATIADAAGKVLEGGREFSFTTQSDLARGSLARLTVFEPGATNLVAEGIDVRSMIPGFNLEPDRKRLVVAYGSPGTADGRVPVILVNETSGETSTVLSKGDGSFAGFIRGTAEDFVSAVFVNANGTRTTVAATRQLFDGGSVGLYQAGGILEAEGDGGKIQVQVAPGAVVTRSTFKLSNLGLAAALEAAKGVQPSSAQLLGGIQVELGGDPVSDGAASEVSIPFDPASLHLPPGESPEEGAFALAIPTQINGETAYRVVDKLKLRNGKLESNTLPFLGFLAAALAQEAVTQVSLFTLTYLFVGNQQIVVTGKTLQLAESANPLNPQLQPVRFGKPLAGAFVTARPAQLATLGKTGRIGNGTLFSTSGEDGVYALVVGRKTFDLVAPFKDYVVTATHPSFEDTPSNVLDTSFGTAAIEYNFTFSERVNAGSLAQHPRVTTSLTPRYPALGEIAELKVLAEHLQVAPTVSVELQSGSLVSFVPGVTVNASDVSLQFIDEVKVGKKTTQRYRLSSTKSLETGLRISAIATLPGHSFSGEAFETIRFGIPAPQVPEQLQPADPSDVTGPTVVGTYPQTEGLLSPGERIAIRFNEAIRRSVTNDPTAVVIAGVSGVSVGLQLSDDQQTLFVVPPLLNSGPSYELILTTSIRDLAGNSLKRTASEASGASHSIRFRVAPVSHRKLAGLQQGGGAVVHKGHVFALERNAEDGSGQLVVYRLQDVLSSSTSLAGPVARRTIASGFPRDLTLIPNYSFRRKLQGTVETTDLLAVVGGTVGAGGENENSAIPLGQLLRVFDLSNLESPELLVGGRLSLRPDVVSVVRWSPPHLTYLEVGSDLQQIGIIDLQEMITGFLASPEEAGAFPLFGIKGIDANADGDYADPGDRPPTPEHSPSEFYGKKLGLTLESTSQVLLDYDYLAPFELAVGIVNRGKVRNALGQPIGADRPPSLRVLMAGGEFISDPAGVLRFDLNTRLQRVFLLPGQSLPNRGTLQTLNLVLVSLSAEDGSSPALAVCDISVPRNPGLLAMVNLPAGIGIPKSVVRRPDGLLALVTSEHQVLLDPVRLLLPPGSSGMLHPAITSVVGGAGTGNRTVVTTESGLTAVSLGSRNEVLVTAPKLRFIHFPTSTGVVQPSQLVNNAVALEAEFGRAKEANNLLLSRVRTLGGAVSSLDPAQPIAHYHVLMDAPGEAGPSISFALETLNEAGHPIENKGALFPPVRAMSSFALGGIRQTTRTGYDAPIGSLKAFRLSSDPKSPFYNKFLSRPFVLISEKITPTALQTLQNAVDREILWSGPLIRASIDPIDSANPLLADFISSIDAGSSQLRPGVVAMAITLSGHYLFGPNPPPIGGELSMPYTYGMVNAANGEIRDHTVDIALPSRRMPIQFVRHYSGQDLFQGPFGRGWDFNYNDHLIEYRPELFPEGNKKPLVIRSVEAANSTVQSGDVVWSTGEGRIILFRKVKGSPPLELTSDPLLKSLSWFDAGNAGAVYFVPGPNESGVFDVLCRFPSGEFCRVTSKGLQYWYGQSGRLERIYDRFPKNRHLLLYNERNELVKIVDESVTADRYLRIGYFRRASDPLLNSDIDRVTEVNGTVGKIARLKDYTETEEREILFEYDSAGKGLLESRKSFKLEGVNGGFTGRPTTTYQWDAGGTHLIGLVEGNGANGGASSGTPLFSAAMSVNGEQAPVVTSGSGAGGAVSITVPQDASLNSAASVANIQSKNGAPDGAKTDFGFDAKGYPASVLMSKPGDVAGNATYTPVYDAFGRLSSVTYPLGNSVTYTYASNPQTLRSRPNILSTTLEPGPRGGATLVSSQAGGYDLNYNLPVGNFVNFNGKTLTYKLTSDAREVAEITFGTAGKQTTSFNDFGQVELETSPEGVIRDPSYNGDDGFVESVKIGNLTTRFGYATQGGFSKAGILGQITSIQLPKSGSAGLKLEFNARLNKTRATRGSNDELLGYDEAGNVVFSRRTLDAGQVYEESKSYDQLNFLRSMTQKGVLVDGISKDLTTQFIPDAAFRVKEIRYPDGSIRSFQYDHLGHRVRMSLGSGPDVEDDHENYAQDLHGNMISMSRRGQVLRTVTYDGHDRALSIANKTGGSRADDVVSFTYFGEGQRRLTQVGGGGNVVSESEVTDIDELGRPKVEELRGGQASGTRSYTYQTSPSGGMVTTITGPRDVTKVTLDAAGRTNRMENGLASLVYRLDDNGNVERRESTEDGVTYTQDFTYDALDHRLTQTDPAALSTPYFTYVPRLDGQPREVRDGRDKRSTMEYSVLGELVARRGPPAGGLGVDFLFQFDTQRQTRKITDRDSSGNETVYDPQMRPIAQKLRNGAQVGFSSFNTQNQPQTITLPGGGTIDRTGGYDLQGRLIKQSTSFDQRSYKVDSTVYDALGHVLSIQYGSTLQYSASFKYDKLGPLTEATYNEAGGPFTVKSSLRSDSRRTLVTYPSGVAVDEVREPSGRLQELRLGARSIWKVTGFQGAEQPGTIDLGGALLEVREFDARKRLVARRYEKTQGGAALVDLRIGYDAADNVIAVQHLDRAGRAEVFTYDDANRLVFAEYGARPSFEGAVRQTATLSGGSGLAPGIFGRTYLYDAQGKDLLQGGGNPVNPDAVPDQGQGGGAVVSPLSIPPFAASLGGFDAFLHSTSVDGVSRGAPDALGNVKGTVLWSRSATASSPSKVTGAILSHDALNRLVSIVMPTGTELSYEHQPGGLLHHRSVKVGGSNVSERFYVWDEGRLIEEYEKQGQGVLLVGRYYYADSDAPVAAHLLDRSSGQLNLFFYLCDHLSSVVAIADDTGVVRERVRYDAWGQASLESLDTAPPRVAQVSRSANGDLLLQMSEAVLPSPTSTASGIVTTSAGLGNMLTITQGATPVAGTLEYVEGGGGGASFGTLIRFRPSKAVTAQVTVQVTEGAVVDEWGNGNRSETITLGTGVGLLFTGQVANTAPTLQARSALGNSFLFQGQYTDYDSGLVYMRARFYDPFTGQFLERDPEGYEDSVNLYAAFGNNPSSRRDPTGRNWWALGRALVREMEFVGQVAPRVARAETTEVLMSTRSLFTRRALSSAELEVAEHEGHQIVSELGRMLKREQAAGRYGGIRLDKTLAPLRVEEGRLVGTLGQRGDLAGRPGASVIELNPSLLDSAFPASVEMREAHRFNVFYHEADHLWSVFTTGRPTGRGGIPYFLEEYRAFRSGTLAEIAVMGRNAPVRTAMRASFEANGPAAFADAVLNRSYLPRIVRELPASARSTITTAEEFHQFLIQARNAGL